MEPKPAFLAPRYGCQFEDSAVAEVYRKRPPYPAEIFDLMAAMAPMGNDMLLDLGAGTGELAIPMAAKGFQVTAVEPSGAMLKIAAQLPGAREVSWLNTSAESFDYPDRYGLITCGQCLGWMDWPQVFPRMAHALDRSGLLMIVGQPDPFARAPWQAALRALIAEYSTNQEFIPFDLIPGLEQRGLLSVEGTKQSAALPFTQSIDDFVESIHARNGFSRQRMPAARASTFDHLVQSLLEAHHPDGNLRGELVATLAWGKPLVPNRQSSPSG